MANRLTKGKALIGSLDVQGSLTVNGAPVGSGGGGGGVGPAMVYTAYVDPQDMMSERWTPGMGYFQILNYDQMNPQRQQNFLSDNGINNIEQLVVEKVEWYDFGTQQFVDFPRQETFGKYNAAAYYDSMWYQMVIRVIQSANPTYGMGNIIPRFTFKREG